MGFGESENGYKKGVRLLCCSQAGFCCLTIDFLNVNRATKQNSPQQIPKYRQKRAERQSSKAGKAKRSWPCRLRAGLGPGCSAPPWWASSCRAPAAGAECPDVLGTRGRFGGILWAGAAKRARPGGETRARHTRYTAGGHCSACWVWMSSVSGTFYHFKTLSACLKLCASGTRAVFRHTACLQVPGTWQGCCSCTRPLGAWCFRSGSTFISCTGPQQLAGGDVTLWR